jgi:hypothetical protein
MTVKLCPVTRENWRAVAHLEVAEEVNFISTNIGARQLYERVGFVVYEETTSLMPLPLFAFYNTAESYRVARRRSRCCRDSSKRLAFLSTLASPRVTPAAMR